MACRSHQLQNTDELSVLRHYRYLTREEALSYAELAQLQGLLNPANTRRSPLISELEGGVQSRPGRPFAASGLAAFGLS